MGQYHPRVDIFQSEIILAEFLIYENVNWKVELSHITSLNLTGVFPHKDQMYIKICLKLICGLMKINAGFQELIWQLIKISVPL
jgi:hypothetical protein